jgi:hypothetical protein
MTNQRYQEALRAAGLDQKTVNKIVQADARQNELDNRTCPSCGGLLSREVDFRQDGYKPGGTWVKYRCRCGFMMDRAENLTPRAECV